MKWFRDSVTYHILIDRFAGYDPAKNWQKPLFMGGNLAGIREKLPYLQDLGINTIWLSPVYTTQAYHGYHVTDFFQVDPHFGSDQDLSNLIETAHNMNIRIILDFVPNHCSFKHPIFQYALYNRNSQYRKWFYFKPFSNQYLSFLNFKELPKINLNYTEARKHILYAAIHFLNKGIDGFRLDHAVGPGHSFWKQFSNEIKTKNKEAVLIGEAWMEGIQFSHLNTIRIRNKYLRWLFDLNPRDIQREYTSELDGVLDFYFRNTIIQHIAHESATGISQNNVINKMQSHYKHFPDHYFLPTFVDNHDMSRFIHETGQNIEKLKTALKIQFCLPQPPILYYGTETALSHDMPVHLNIPYSDLQARRPMPWNSLNLNLINFCKELIAQRKKTG